MDVTTPMLTVEQVAVLLSTTPKTVYGLVRDARLRASKIPGVGWRIDPVDLATFVEETSNSSCSALAEAS